MKINFKQPKFILPLIFFPFILLFFWIFDSWGSKKKDAEIAKADSLLKVRTDVINPVLPGTSAEVSNQQIEGKFESYQEAYKHTKDASAVQTLEIPTDSSANRNGYSSSYSQQDLKRIEAQENLRKLQDQLNQNRSLSNTRMERIMNSRGTTTKTPEEIIALARQQSYEANAAGSDRRSSSGSTVSKDQMSIFREQMAVMDSMDKAKRASHEDDNYASSGTSNEGKNRKKRTGEAIIPSKDSSYKPLSVSLSPMLKSSSNFNTIRAFQSDNSIKAIIDEDEKGYAGSRVRMRLLDNIYVGENLIPKNTYLYGIITGFQTSRVNITVTQIIFNDMPLPVHLDVFDNDGYLGLYVPGSNFREFTKEIGSQSTSGLSSIQTSSGEQDFTSSLISKVFQSSGSSITKLIHQNKATLKYNYIIYLKEKNK